MLLIIGIVLALAWILGFLVFHVAASAIHVLLLVALVVVVVHLVRGRGTSPPLR